MPANGWISEHLTLSEVRCKCRGRPFGPTCDGGVLRWETAELFERIRRRCTEQVGRSCPIHISSGVRCEEYNLRIGGATDSQHLAGRALDLRCPQEIGLEEFWAICEEEAGLGGCGRYPWGAHVDTHITDPPRRWRLP
jgi:uncharacterized protein YcbK (DUF882 family)